MSMLLPKSPKEILANGRKEILDHLHETAHYHPVATTRLLDALSRYFDYRLFEMQIERKESADIIAGTEKALSELRTLKTQLQPKEK